MNSLRKRFIALSVAVLISGAIQILAAISAPTLPDPGSVPGITKEQQTQLGLKAAGEVYKQMPILPDSNPVPQYVQQLGQKLARVIPSQYSWPYQFHVVQQKEVNAFALPGGPIFINIGTITQAGNEAQLAGVMAHEMSHVYMQHSIKQAVKQQREQGLAGILGGALGAVLGGTVGSLARTGVNIGAGLLTLKYSRADEAQADQVGAIIMYKAGYDPLQLAAFFQQLEAQGSAGPQFLSDHPNPGNRYEAIRKEIENWPRQDLATNAPQFTQVKQEASQVRAYTAQQIADMAKHGQIRNTSVPSGIPVSRGGSADAANTVENVSRSQIDASGSYQTYSNQVLSIEYPSNWKVFGGGQGSNGIVIAPPAGVSGNAIAYGGMIGSFNPQGAQSLDAATQQLISSLRQSNPDLQQTGNIQSVSTNGTQAKSVEMTGVSPLQSGNAQPARERDWLVTVPVGNELLYLIFIAPDNDFSRLRPTFQHMLHSLRLNQ